MRVFTDGSCTKNGRPGAKAGFAAWFPDHPELSAAERIPDNEPQTNQRAELRGIALAVSILVKNGLLDEDLVIYTDSDYSINCLTKWLPGWVSRNWKTSDGKDVLHKDVIQEVSSTLSKFKSHRFHHVRAHTGGGDDLSKNNDRVDKMARATVDDTVVVVETPAEDVLFAGCPLQLMGPPVAQSTLTKWMRQNLDALDAATVDKHLLKLFAELCKTRDVSLTKQTLQKTPMVRAERAHLQITRVEVEKVE